jgi:hypothetical protein
MILTDCFHMSCSAARLHFAELKQARLDTLVVLSDLRVAALPAVLRGYSMPNNMLTTAGTCL